MSPEPETLDSLWDYCKSAERVVPMPMRWNELFGKLKNKTQLPSGGWEPPLPLILAAWHDSSPIAKQLRFRTHLDWAAQHGQPDEVGQLLRALPEDQWCHYGEV